VYICCTLLYLGVLVDCWSDPVLQLNSVEAYRVALLQVLVASDVASCGLGIRGLPYVVRYNFPNAPNAVHCPHTCNHLHCICDLQVLVASDVASRGLDIRGLPYVVQYDFPSNLETYIHRVGRTGRLAASGHAYSFFTRSLVS
jgi:superfamily II DNA/RNA helicase